ncbi:MAG TPA: hypothetical protein VHY19_08660 [Steroidobacteraceae bacterium]|nr:hypothetical protein [Steroidobacteraceae bacterium]
MLRPAALRTALLQARSRALAALRRQLLQACFLRRRQHLIERLLRMSSLIDARHGAILDRLDGLGVMGVTRVEERLDLRATLLWRAVRAAAQLLHFQDGLHAVPLLIGQIQPPERHQQRAIKHLSVAEAATHAHRELRAMPAGRPHATCPRPAGAVPPAAPRTRSLSGRTLLSRALLDSVGARIRAARGLSQGAARQSCHRQPR